MNIKMLPSVGLGIALGWLAGTFAFSSIAAEAPTEFPYSVNFEPGRSRFLPGDNVTIQTVHGTAASFTLDATYCVEGTYTLSSCEEAELALFVTTRQEVSTPVGPQQTVRVKKGTGSFRLIETMKSEGFPHVSFYPVSGGSDFGGIYFGQGDWLWRNEGARNASPENAKPVGGELSFEGQNKVLFEFLGNPVEPPGGVDAAYSREGLIKALELAAKQAKVSLKKIAIEDSEFPFLVGLIGEADAVAKVRSEIKKMSGYEDCGGVSSHKCYALNIVPWRAFPSGVAERIAHRLNLREQVFYDRLCANER